MAANTKASCVKQRTKREGERRVGQGDVRRQAYARGQRLAQSARLVVAEFDVAAGLVCAHAGVLRQQAVREALDAMPVARIKDVTQGRGSAAWIRSPLAASGAGGWW